MLDHFPEMRDGETTSKFKSTKSPLLIPIFIDRVSKLGSVFYCCVVKKYQSKGKERRKEKLAQLKSF
jgi:hypothetical protein